MSWIKLSDTEKNRFKGEERILTFISFQENITEYKGALTTFLNQFMIKNRSKTTEWFEAIKSKFEETINIACRINLGKQKSNIFVDSVLYGVSKNIIKLKDKNSSELNNLFEKLASQDEFKSSNTQQGTWRKEIVISRFNKAREIFEC